MLTIILIALSISMDAFSLSLIYGMNKIDFKKRLFISILVGTFHVFMPLLGYSFGLAVVERLILSVEIVTSIILFLIAIGMICSHEESEALIFTSVKAIIIFALSVSFDAFTIGTSIFFLFPNMLLIICTFFIFSFLFTILGLEIGNKVNKKIGRYSVTCGGLMLILISIIHLFI